MCRASRGARQTSPRSRRDRVAQRALVAAPAVGGVIRRAGLRPGILLMWTSRPPWQGWAHTTGFGKGSHERRHGQRAARALGAPGAIAHRRLLAAIRASSNIATARVQPADAPR